MMEFELDSEIAGMARSEIEAIPPQSHAEARVAVSVAFRVRLVDAMLGC